MRKRVLLAVVPVLLFAAACSSNFGAPDSVTEQGDDFLTLWRGFVITAICIGLLVYGLIIFAVLRYRRRGDAIPDQRPHQVALEITYTVVPLLIVVALFATSVITQDHISDQGDDPDLTVRIVGFQWQWQFQYPEERVTIEGTPEQQPELVLPVGQTVRLELVANDVVHSFWVPDFLSKKDLIPDVDNEIDVDVTEEGEWIGRCAEFCGVDHWNMRFTVRAVPEDEFEAWIAEHQGDGA